MDFQNFRWDRFSWKPPTALTTSGIGSSSSAVTATIRSIVSINGTAESVSSGSAHIDRFIYADGTASFLSDSTGTAITEVTLIASGSSMLSNQATLNQIIDAVAKSGAFNFAWNTYAWDQFSWYGGSLDFAWDYYTWDRFSWYVDPFSHASANAVLRDAESMWGASFSSASANVTLKSLIAASGHGVSDVSLSPVMRLSLVGFMDAVSSAALLSNQINAQIQVGNIWHIMSLVEINIGGSWKNVAEIKINTGYEWKSI